MTTKTARLLLTLYPTPQEVGRARDAVRHWLTDMGFAASIDDGLQITSEIVTNAIEETQKANTAAKVALHLFVVENRPMLQVWDCSARPPATQIEDLAAERGRGVLIARALAANFGYEIFPTGKVVWAVFPAGQQPQ